MIDNHTHNLHRDAVVNLDPTSVNPGELYLRRGYMYSVGIHPWNVLIATAADERWVRALAADPRVVAIGETGLDSVHVGYKWERCDGDWNVVETHPDLDAQMAMLDFHIFLSEHLRKPLLLHIVKRYPEIIRLRGKLKPAQPWVIHGFRGKPGLAQELLKAGFYLSYGGKFNPQSVAVTPPDRLLVETDDTSIPVSRVASLLGVRPRVTLHGLCARS